MKKIEYIDIAEWISNQYHLGEEKTKSSRRFNRKKINSNWKKLKVEIAAQEIEYLAKEKQISTFLECKKSFLENLNIILNIVKKNNKNKVKKEEKYR